MEADLERILVESIQLETENITLKQLIKLYQSKPAMQDQLKNMLHYNQQKLLCAKKIRRELEENKNLISNKLVSKKAVAPSNVEVTIDTILSLFGKTSVDIKEGAGYHRQQCELDIEDIIEADSEDQKTEEMPNILDRTEEIETEDTIVQQQRPVEMVTSSEDEEDATMETVSTDQERMPVTPINKKGKVLASTVQKSNLHKARRMSPILSPISKESNSRSSNEENSSEDIGFRPTKNIFSDSSSSSRLCPSAGLHGPSRTSSITDLKKPRIKDLKNRLSNHGVEESSFKYDKKQTLVDKVFKLESSVTKKVSKCPPNAKPKAVSKLLKSASESDLGTPPRKGSTSKRIFCLTPNQNETKKRKSEEERGRKKTTQKAPPNAAKNQYRGGIRHGSQSRSASRSPGRGMTKSSSLFDLKESGTPVRQGPKSLFDTPKKDERNKKQTNEDKRLEFIKKQKENEEKLRKKKEEQEAERLRKNKEKEENLFKVLLLLNLFFQKCN
jgi:hypothetical protein